jgi:peptidoglycan biosynthesis protein MviN/MurJ (putative lipid II flippase)
MIVSFVSIVINYAMSRTMVNVVGLGHAGLALSTSTVAIFSALALMLVMRNRVNGIYGRDLRSTVFKVSTAAILMGASVWLSSHGIRMLLGVSKLARWGDLAVSIPLGLAVFYTICRLTRVAELEMALRAVAGPLQRRLPFLRAKIAS